MGAVHGILPVEPFQGMGDVESEELSSPDCGCVVKFVTCDGVLLLPLISCFRKEALRGADHVVVSYFGGLSAKACSNCGCKP